MALTTWSAVSVSRLASSRLANESSKASAEAYAAENEGRGHAPMPRNP